MLKASQLFIQSTHHTSMDSLLSTPGTPGAESSPSPSLNSSDAELPTTTIALLKSYSTDALDTIAVINSDVEDNLNMNISSIHITNNTINNHLTISPPKQKLLTSLSDNELLLHDSASENDAHNEIMFDNLMINPNQLGTSKHKQLNRWNSVDFTQRKTPHRSKYGKRTKKKLRSKINEQRKSLFEKFTNIADDYEDQMNEKEQEFEAKLLEAEIEKKKLEEEVRRLRGLLAARDNSQQSVISDSTTNTANIGAVSPCQRTTATLGQSPFAPPLVPVHSHGSVHSVNSRQSQSNYSHHQQQQQQYHPLYGHDNANYNSNNSGLYHHEQQQQNAYSVQHSNHSHGSLHQRQDTPLFRAVSSSNSVDVVSVAAPMMVTNTVTATNRFLPTTSMELREVSDEGMYDGNTMQERLRDKMSPSMRHSVEFSTEIAKSFAGVSATSPLEGTDDDSDTGYVFADDYDHFEHAQIGPARRHNHHQHRPHHKHDNRHLVEYQRDDDSDADSTTPQPVVRKKKKRKKKKIQEPKSFWDVLVKCMTPTICEADTR